jgi:hypothetical protein
MLIGQSLFAPNGSTVTYYGPWMPRQGNTFLAVVQVMKQSASGWSVVCDIETKNAEDPDSAVGSPIGTVTITTPTTGRATATGCLELVRTKYSVTGSGGDRWLHLRANPPIWLPN